jgi:hypothetical protein
MLYYLKEILVYNFHVGTEIELGVSILLTSFKISDNISNDESALLAVNYTGDIST